MVKENAVRVALVLAAGRGQRMRSTHPKALRRVGGISLLERSVRVLRRAGVERIVVVLGYRADEVIAAIKTATCRWRWSSTRIGRAVRRPRC